MTRTYAMMKLLEHGGLTRQELLEITGWTSRQVHSTLAHLSENEKIRKDKKMWVLNATEEIS
jgi:hypothetical protein